MKHHPPLINLLHARDMRRNPTEAEKAMRRLLREFFPQGRWRRQVRIVTHIADFCSHRLRLVIEVDGGQHDAETDAPRTAAIEGEGYCVLRFWNPDVLANREGVATVIAQWLAAHPLPASTRRRAAKSSHPSPIEGEEK